MFVFVLNYKLPCSTSSLTYLLLPDPIDLLLPDNVSLMKSIENLCGSFIAVFHFDTKCSYKSDSTV